MIDLVQSEVSDQNVRYNSLFLVLQWLFAEVSDLNWKLYQNKHIRFGLSLSWLVWKQILSSKEVRKVRGFRVEFCRLYRDRTAKNKLAVYDINLNQFHSQIISNLLSLISRLNTLSNIFLP